MKFSLKWFKSKKEEELKDLQLEGQKLENELLKKQIANASVEVSGPVEDSIYKGTDFLDKVVEKPYVKLSLVNDVLIVVLFGGDVVTKTSATVEDFHRVRAAKSEVEVISIVTSPEAAKDFEKRVEEQVKAQNVYEGFDILKNLSDFEIKEGSVYLKGISRSLPELLVQEFLEIAGSYKDYSVQQTEELLLKDVKFQALKRFFMWCCLNPRAEVAEQLYGFLKRNDFKITKQGFFVALRNVVKVRGNDAHNLVDFITNAYNKVKAVWKKKPVDFTVFTEEDGSYSFVKTENVAKPAFQSENNTIIGNLNDLYHNLPTMEENHYTDNWSKSFDIRIGQKVSMDPAKCSWSTRDCAEAGLHFAGHTAPYVLCGDTTVFTLHNPMKVVGIGSEKGRCWEYLPFMTTTVKEADAIMNDAEFDFLQLDEKYAVEELEGLVEKVKTGFTAETTKHDFNLPKISISEIKGVVASLEAMKAEISDRVSIIK